MQVLNFLKENLIWDENIHGRLVQFLNAGQIYKAIDIYHANFNNNKELLKFPTILDAIKKSLLDCFKKVQMHDKTFDYHVLTLERVKTIKEIFLKGDAPEFKAILQSPEFVGELRSFIIFQLNTGSLDGIDQAIQAKNLLNQDLDCWADKDLRRALMSSLLRNFVNEEKVFADTIEKIRKSFLDKYPQILIGAAISAAEYWRDRSNKERSREIYRNYLWNDAVGGQPFQKQSA